MRAVLDSHRDDPALHRALFEQAPRPPELLALLHAAEERIVQAFAGLLAADPQVRVTVIDMAARLEVGATGACPGRRPRQRSGFAFTARAVDRTGGHGAVRWPS